MSAPTEPWSRAPGEGARAHQALRLYLEAGPSRSLTAVAQRLHKSRSLVGRWSARYAWSARAAAYDAALAAAFDHELAEARREAVRVHVAQADKSLQVFGQWLAQVDGASLSVAEAVSLRRSALEAQRVVLGLDSLVAAAAAPAESDAGHDCCAVEEMTDEERLEQLRRLRDEADRRITEAERDLAAGG